MSSPPQQQDLFGYPTDARATNDHAYIDQVDSATDEGEEEPLSDPDDDVLSDLSDDLRVEDEDWEIAERGLSFFFRSLLSFISEPFFLRQISLNSTIDFDSTSPCDPKTARQTRSRRP